MTVCLVNHGYAISNMEHSHFLHLNIESFAAFSIGVFLAMRCVIQGCVTSMYSVALPLYMISINTWIYRRRIINSNKHYIYNGSRYIGFSLVGM